MSNMMYPVVVIGKIYTFFAKIQPSKQKSVFFSVKKCKKIESGLEILKKCGKLSKSTANKIFIKFKNIGEDP